MRCWGDGWVRLHQCLKDTQPVDAHVKAPQIPSTNHWTYTHKPGGSSSFYSLKRSCVHQMNAFHGPFLRTNPRLVRRDHNYASENRIVVTSRCSGLCAKQHELTQHTAYRGYCNTHQNAWLCVSCCLTLHQSQFFCFFPSSGQKFPTKKKTAEFFKGSCFVFFKNNSLISAE